MKKLEKLALKDAAAFIAVNDHVHEVMIKHPQYGELVNEKMKVLWALPVKKPMPRMAKVGIVCITAGVAYIIWQDIQRTANSAYGESKPATDA